MRTNNGFKGLLVAMLALSLTLAACSNDSGTGNGASNEAQNAEAGSGHAANGSVANGDAEAGSQAGSGDGDGAVSTPAANSPSEGSAAAGNGSQEEEAQRWEGRWQLKDANESRGSIITIEAPQGDRAAFMLDAYYLGNPDDENAAPNIGNIPNGVAVVSGNTATFMDESLGFTLTMTLTGDELLVESTQGTGYFGQGVYVDGTYERAAAE